eukprot:TRINITY_DN480_c0_g1_i4.p1 TRINITY_DN480_c0_g1~~TRINITY_DN480_c0_g1_i4.p1  ORF type:complete len:651 (-),score=134.38 TRINITY_DN480_c0_g1_i4:1129-3081(-)
MELWSQGSFLLYGLTFFTSSGYKSASKLFVEDLSQVDMKGKSVLVTGANSGIGMGSCKYFANQGATVHMLCRNEKRGQVALNDIKKSSNSEKLHLHICDLAEQKQIRDFVEKFEKDGHKLDILVNNAGVMLSSKSFTSEGFETTFAINTLSNFLLTTLLIPTLKKSDDPRVIIVSSGGMLTEQLKVRQEYDIQKGSSWSGRTAYARTKRHQLVLCKKFSEVYPFIKFYAMHPGWTATSAVEEAMPDFYQTMKDKLRSIEQGCDTINWLATTNSLNVLDNGEYFRDRQREIQHFCLSKTKYPSYMVESLWNWCKESSNLGPNPNQLRKINDKLKLALNDEGKIYEHKIGLKGYKNTFSGTAAIITLCNLSDMKKGESMSIIQHLIDFGFIHPAITGKPKQIFDNNELYKFHHVPTVDELKDLVNENWIQEIMDTISINDNEGWEEAKKFNDTDNTIIYMKNVMPASTTKLKACKLITYTDASLKQLLDVLNDRLIERHKEWNESFASGYVVESVTKNIEVHYWKFTMPGLDPRDFVVIRRLKKLPGGAVAIFERSIPQYGRCPKNKNIIRSEVIYQVRYIKELDNKKCMIVSSNLTDIKGWIPSSVANSSNIDISYQEISHIKTSALNTIFKDEGVVDGEQILVGLENPTD